MIMNRREPADMFWGRKQEDKIRLVKVSIPTPALVISNGLFSSESGALNANYYLKN